MASMVIRHTVRDFDAWKTVFDGVADVRKAGGELSGVLLRNESNPNEILAVFEWESLEKAHAFVESPELKAAMAEAGVMGPPDILFTTEAIAV